MADDIVKKAQEEYAKMMGNFDSLVKDMVGRNNEDLDAAIKAQMEMAQKIAGNVNIEEVMAQGQAAVNALLAGGQNPELAAAMKMYEAVGGASVDEDVMGEVAKNHAEALKNVYGKTPEELMAGMLSGEYGGYGDEEYEPLSFEDILVKFNELRQLPEPEPISVGNGNEYIAHFEILLSGILCYLNGHETDSLDVEERNNEFFEEKINGILREAWGIESREDFAETLEWLLEEGHNAEYSALCGGNSFEEFLSDDMNEEDVEEIKNGFEFAQFFKDKMPENIMIGWDIGRAAMVTRWAYYMDYITEDETWSILGDIAQTAIENFNFWREFGISYIFGGLFWTYKGNPEGLTERFYETAQALEGLLSEDEFEDQPEWRKYPWIKEVL